MVDKTYRGRSQKDVLAELLAMRASGEISPEEFKAARARVLVGDESRPTPTTTVIRERVVEVERRKKSGGCGTVLVGIIVVVIIASVIGSQSKTGSSSGTTTPAITAAETAEKAEDKRKGFHCLSSWDGSHRELARTIKENLREPGSFEHVETRITPVDAKGQHSVVMTYRGRNGFGGVNVESAIGVISNSDCSLVSVATE